jgi:superfamily II helicase
MFRNIFPVKLIRNSDSTQYREKLDLSIEMPETCPKCQFSNFYLWGTKINGCIHVEFRCIRCGSEEKEYTISDDED